MTSATLILVLFATGLAFWTGSRWRHNARTWSDTRAAKTGWKKMKKTRWVTLKAVGIASAATFVYLLGTGVISFATPNTPHQPSKPQPGAQVVDQPKSRPHKSSGHR
jgi:ABC-type Fe3+ transport system permease subunit